MSLSSSRTIPPVVHAVGGCVGSALSLALLYPLERARIEMQSKAAATATTSDHHRYQHQHQNNDCAIMIASSSSSSSEGDDSWCTADQVFADAQEDEKQAARSSSASSSSWERQQSPPQHAAETVQRSESSSSTSSMSHCLYDLWRRGQLYQGVVPILTAVALSNFVFFLVNEWVKLHLLQQKKTTRNNSHSQQQQQQHSQYGLLLASCLAGIGNVLLTNPIWLISFRISAGRASKNNNNNNNNNLFQELWCVARQEGFWHLWRTGLTSSLLLVSNPVIQFVLYEQLKEWQLLVMTIMASSKNSSTRNDDDGAYCDETTTTTIMNHHHHHLSPIRAFCTGALAKAVSTTITYPLQLTQTVMRLQEKQLESAMLAESSSNNNNTDPEISLQPNTKAVQQQQQHTHYRNVLHCLRQLYQQKGLSGLYTGMRAKLLQTVLTAAFTFLTYEQILRAVLVAHRNLFVASTKQQQQQQTKNKRMYK